MPLPARFTKVAGGGNDFLLFESDGRAATKEDLRRLALVCRRGLSVGADGALFLSSGEAGRLRLDYYNSDGSLASFCANGTRCAARYAVRHGLSTGDPVIETGWAVIPARVEDRSVTLRLPPLEAPRPPVRAFGDGMPATAIPMPVGVPHLVVFVERGLADLPIERLAPPLRWHPDLPAGGTNVNFVEILEPGRFAIRTFERGIEGETLACGSGVVAAAVVASREGRVCPPVLCETRSGVAFIVDLPSGPGGLDGVTLQGDAREVYSGQLTEEAWEE
jgi:diaminopimelate epimerase